MTTSDWIAAGGLTVAGSGPGGTMAMVWPAALIRPIAISAAPMNAIAGHAEMNAPNGP